MGEGLTRGELIDRLRESRLLAAEEIDRACAASGAADGAGLAGALVAAGVLTAYQVQAVCNRAFAELRIGNYEILDRLGAGGMGTVFKARHRRMKRVVALKLLAQALGRDATFVQRFQREVETIARLTHPNVVMAYDADESEVGHFLVMEYVNGQDLVSLVQKRGPLPLAAAVDCTVQAARGLAYAHGQGIIHRDVKPANLLYDEHGFVKVTDLGLARFSGAAGAASATSGLTQAGGMLGTVDYMPPEQALDATAIDHRADIYSLGATLHYLLLGQPPYTGATIMATLLKHRDAPVPSLTAARGDVPAALDEVFRRMLAKAPADRFPSMAEVVAALEALQPGLGPVPSFSPGPGEPPAGPVTPVPASPETTIVAPPPGAGPTVDIRRSSPTTSGRRSVLLVEPSRTQAGIIRKYLQALDVEHVATAASGREALQAVRDDPPDAILSALHLEDMTGVELARQIRDERKAAAPGFVLISSESESQQANLLNQSGQAVVLHKPFTPEMLAQALGQAAPRFLSLKPPAGGLKPPSRAARRADLRVLIVDDSSAARVHARTVLGGLGFTQFVEAADGAQAVAAATREPFHLVVTDYNMPLMDGAALVGYLKQNPATAAVPIVMVTTETDPAKLEAVRRLGVAAVCDKSFRPEAVRDVIDRLL